MPSNVAGAAGIYHGKRQLSGPQRVDFPRRRQVAGMKPLKLPRRSTAKHGIASPLNLVVDG